MTFLGKPDEKQADFIRYKNYQKSYSKKRSYFHEITIDQYDYSYVETKISCPDWFPFTGCSSVRSGNLHGRNLDYYYNEYPEFLVRVPSKEGRYGSIAMVQYPHIVESDVENRTAAYRNSIKMLPFIVMDGMNDQGLVTNQNMLPVGDNPNHRDLFNTYDEDGTEHLHDNWNRLAHTNPGKHRRCLTMLQRTLLDNCATVDDALSTIGEYDWFCFLQGGTTLKDGLELHFMISDPNKTAIVEFVVQDNNLSCSDTIAHIYEKSGDTFSKSYVMKNGEIIGESGSNQKPIMTNFYITNWNGDMTGFEKPSIISNDTLTRYSMGLERYKVLSQNYKDNMTSSDMLSCMEAVEYSHAYQMSADQYHGGNWGTLWYSEFCDPLLSSIVDQNGERHGYHFSLEEQYISANAYGLCREYEKQLSAQDRKNADPCWITVNRSVYDMDKKVLHVVVQQDKIVMSFGFDS